MVSQDLGVTFFIVAMISLLLVLGGFFLWRKRSLSGRSPEDLAKGLIKRIKNTSGKIPETIFMRMKDSGVNLVPFLLKIWPELSLEKREQLWQFWHDEGYIDILIKGLGAKNEERRVETAQVLMGINHKKMILPLMDALSSPDQYVPARVAEVLLSYGPDAVGPIIGRLPELSDEAKCLAISILEEIGDPKAIPCLLKELSHPSSQVRMKTVEALGEMGNGDVVGRMIGMMEDVDWGVRSRVAKALGKTNNPQAIPVLKLALQDEAWWVRTNAQEALKRIT